MCTKLIGKMAIYTFIWQKNLGAYAAPNPGVRGSSLRSSPLALRARLRLRLANSRFALAGVCCYTDEIPISQFPISRMGNPKLEYLAAQLEYLQKVCNREMSSTGPNRAMTMH